MFPADRTIYKLMNFQATRRSFLRVCGVGSIPFGLAACAPGEVVCEVGNWALPVKPAGVFFDCLQMSVMSDAANLIVGDGDWPTADDAHVVTYLDQIFGEWAGPDLKVRMSRLAEHLGNFAVQQQGRAYVQLNQEQRLQTLRQYDAAAFADRKDEANATYIEFKTLVLKIYNTSAEANRDFVLVPGEYIGNLSASEHLELVRAKALEFAG